MTNTGLHLILRQDKVLVFTFTIVLKNCLFPNILRMFLIEVLQELLLDSEHLATQRTRNIVSSARSSLESSRDLSLPSMIVGLDVSPQLLWRVIDVTFLDA